MARRPTQIPLDDEPVDIDLGDLPTDEELEAEATDIGAPPTEAPARGGDGGPLAVFQTWFTLVLVFYLLIGLAFGLILAFGGPAHVGLGAMASPRFWLLVFFWPIGLWQIALGQL